MNKGGALPQALYIEREKKSDIQKIVDLYDLLFCFKINNLFGLLI